MHTCYYQVVALQAGVNTGTKYPVFAPCSWPGCTNGVPGERWLRVEAATGYRRTFAREAVVEEVARLALGTVARRYVYRWIEKEPERPSTDPTVQAKLCRLLRSPSETAELIRLVTLMGLSPKTLERLQEIAWGPRETVRG